MLKNLRTIPNNASSHFVAAMARKRGILRKATSRSRGVCRLRRCEANAHNGSNETAITCMQIMRLSFDEDWRTFAALSSTFLQITSRIQSRFWAAIPANPFASSPPGLSPPRSLHIRTSKAAKNPCPVKANNRRHPSTTIATPLTVVPLCEATSLTQLRSQSCDFAPSFHLHLRSC